MVRAELAAPDAGEWVRGRRTVIVYADDGLPGRETLLYYLDATFARVDRIKALFPGAPVEYDPPGNMHPDFAGNRR